jgi:hypothetical protein
MDAKAYSLCTHSFSPYARNEMITYLPGKFLFHEKPSAYRDLKVDSVNHEFDVIAR